MMKEYRYKGYTFRATNTMTEVLRETPGYHGRRHYRVLRPLYEIIGLKECGKSPRLTSIAECKAYIDMEVET